VRLHRCHFEAERTFIVWTLIAHLLLITIAAVNPDLHEWMHEDADHADHECAITLYTAGGYDDAALPVLAVAPKLLPLSDEAVIEQPRFASSFRFNGILEHAPPRRA
jgi:hypothetical protein